MGFRIGRQPPGGRFVPIRVPVDGLSLYGSGSASDSVSHDVRNAGSAIVCIQSVLLRMRLLTDQHGITVVAMNHESGEAAVSPTATEKAQIHVRLDPDIREQLSATARANERSVNAEVRYAVAQHLASQSA